MLVFIPNIIIKLIIGFFEWWYSKLIVFIKLRLFIVVHFTFCLLIHLWQNSDIFELISEIPFELCAVVKRKSFLFEWVRLQNLLRSLSEAWSRSSKSHDLKLLQFLRIRHPSQLWLWDSRKIKQLRSLKILSKSVLKIEAVQVTRISNLSAYTSLLSEKNSCKETPLIWKKKKLT